jgi:hypothetical protein
VPRRRRVPTTRPRGRGVVSCGLGLLWGGVGDVLLLTYRGLLIRGSGCSESVVLRIYRCAILRVGLLSWGRVVRCGGKLLGVDVGALRSVTGLWLVGCVLSRRRGGLE